jgi:hypothetical protein
VGPEPSCLSRIDYRKVYYSQCFAVLNGTISRVDEEYCPALDMPPLKGSSEYGSRLSGMDLCHYVEGFSRRFFDGETKFHMNTGIGIRWDKRGRWKCVQSLSGAFSDTLMFSHIILASGVSTNPFASQSYSTHCSSHLNMQQSENSSQTLSRAANKAGYRVPISTCPNVLNEALPQTETVGAGVVGRGPR